jgi:hypothetical protein
MKNLLNSFAFSAIACIILSSCSNLNITKRHYNKGYYIEYIKHQQTKPQIENGNEVRTNSAVTLSRISYPENHFINEPEFKPEPKSLKEVIMPRYDKRPGNTHQTSIGTVASPASNSNQSPVVQSQRPSFSEASQDRGEGGERAALSLLWIVIVVILILWLIGILAGGFGLGGLINILLIIALILLILWLLRIA